MASNTAKIAIKTIDGNGITDGGNATNGITIAGSFAGADDGCGRTLITNSAVSQQRLLPNLMRDSIALTRP